MVVEAVAVSFRRAEFSATSFGGREFVYFCGMVSDDGEGGEDGDGDDCGGADLGSVDDGFLTLSFTLLLLVGSMGTAFF